MRAPWSCTAGTLAAPRSRPGASFGGPDRRARPHSAGVGRTGCFIVIDAMLERIKPEKTVDVYGHVTLMRSQRNYMVQTEDQYSFIHEALLEAVGCGNTEVPARSLYAYIQKLAQVEPGEHVTGMELEFKVGGRPRWARSWRSGLPPLPHTPHPPRSGWEDAQPRWPSPGESWPPAGGCPAVTPGLLCPRSGWPTPKPTHPASSVPICLVTSSRTAW